MLLDLRSLYESASTGSTPIVDTTPSINPGAGPMWPMLSAIRARPKKKPKKTPRGFVDDSDFLEILLFSDFDNEGH